MVIGAKVDFDTILAERKETVTWYANTKTTDSQSGDEIESFATGASVNAILTSIPWKDIYNSSGELTDQHAYLMVGSTNSINLKDKIVRDNVSFTVENILKQVYDGGTLVYRKYLLRRLVDDA